MGATHADLIEQIDRLERDLAQATQETAAVNARTDALVNPTDRRPDWIADTSQLYPEELTERRKGFVGLVFLLVVDLALVYLTFAARFS